MKNVFEKSKKGRTGLTLPEYSSNKKLDAKYLREDLRLPEISEVDMVRHYTQLSKRTRGIDDGIYPLGSCTMKYNPKVNEKAAGMFLQLHPYQQEKTVQGALKIMHRLEKYLCEITGMDSCTLQPAAGAHGELTGLMLIHAYHEDNGKQRKKVVVPDSAHGTNPASATMCGYQTVTIKSNEQGIVDLKLLEETVDEETAAVMLTNPNTLGLFEKDILEISRIVHSKGALLYCDGANMNAIIGKARPGDMGFDVAHLNLHKTFSTPHGGGGPGSGPVAVKKILEEFLPLPRIEKKREEYSFNYDKQKSIGKMKAFYGNFNVIVKAYSYILSLGPEGLREAAENSVLNANYLKACMKEDYDIAYEAQSPMHEFVATNKKQGITTLNIAKRLIDYGIHPFTVYFPLIVKEAMLIEPTETESLESLNNFADIMKRVSQECKENPDIVKKAPHKAPVKRVDEVKAAREPNLAWREKDETDTTKPMA